MPFHGDRFRACWPGLLLLLVSGCGVGAYESKMLEAQARVKRVDEESTLLDAPLVIPPREKNDGSKVLASVYLRPPLGINSEAVNAAEPRLGLFWTYDLRDPKTSRPVARVEVAVSDKEKFAADVLRCFNAPDKPGRPVQFPGPTRDSVTTFETTELDDGTYFYSINIWRGEGNKAAAVVYLILRDQRAAATKVVEVSLGTFAVDAEAERRKALQGKPSLQPPRHP